MIKNVALINAFCDEWPIDQNGDFSTVAAIMLVEILLGVACILGYCYWILQRKWTTFWAEQGVKTPPTSFPFGNTSIFNWHVFLRTKNVIDVAREQYVLFKNEKVYGTYMFTDPQLVIKDVDIMKQIMVKDFNQFVERNR